MTNQIKELLTHCIVVTIIFTAVQFIFHHYNQKQNEKKNKIKKQNLRKPRRNPSVEN